jgi:hypothetical protein
MRKTLKTVAAQGALVMLFLVPQVVGATDYTQEQILKEFEYLKQKVQSQQEDIERLQSVIDETMDKKIDAKVEEKIAKGTDNKVTLGNKFIDQLDIKGDLRVRYERRDVEDGTARDRWRTRFRVGGVWKNLTESWEVGAGLATGGIDGTSTNDTWGDDKIFETGDIRLDYAYAKHKVADFAFTLGQQKNPFVASWLIWDGDLRPTGFTGQFAHDSGFFATAGAYGLELINDDNTAMMYAGQVGYANKIGNVKLTVAAGYQHYDSVFSSAEAPNPDYDFQIGDLYARADIPFAKLVLSPYAQVWNNFGADGDFSQAGGTLDPEDENLGWVAGIDAKMGAFKLGYAYAVVGADSIVEGLKDADFGTGAGDVDVKGHKISGSYNFTKNWSAAVTAMLYESDQRSIDREADLYQFDINYKF